MTSRIASIAGTDPPGEWIHKAMSVDGILGGQGDQLGGEQRPVVVVERAVQHQDAALVELASDGLGEQRWFR